jgi:uncharacterized protein YceK
MRRILLLLAVASVMTGCAAGVPVCDGEERRPINAPNHTEIFYASCGAIA